MAIQDVFADAYLARALQVLRESTRMTSLVQRDLEGFGQEGDTISVPVSRKFTASKVTASHENPDVDDPKPNNFQVKLDQHWRVRFNLTDKDIATMASRDALDVHTDQAIRTLGNKIDETIIGATKFATALGTIGTNPFASNPNNAADCKVALNQNLAPMSERYGLLTAKAEAAFLKLDNVRRAEQFGTREGLARGEIGMVGGITWVGGNTSADAAHDTTADGSPAVNNTGGYAAGHWDGIAFDGATGALQVGDIITFRETGETGFQAALDKRDRQYMIRKIGSGTNGTPMELDRPLEKAITDNQRIDVAADHTYTPVFNRNAIAFVNRTPGLASTGYGRIVRDPQTGVAFRFEMERQNKQTVFDFDALWGVGLLRPEYGVRLFE